MTRSWWVRATTDLTAAAILQRAGLRTVCLEANTYAGGMAATVELIDGFRYEIAGSVQFPTASQITKDLGLDTLPTVEPEVMSTNIGEHGEEPMIFYRDPMQLMTHLGEKHGIEAVTGHGRTDRLEPGAREGPRPLRRPHSHPRPSTRCTPAQPTTPNARAIHEMLFGSAMDVIDRYLPDKDKHAVMRGMLAFLAVNSTYRGPYTPGSATCLAFALAVPDDSTAMMTKLKGGIGALTEHLRELFVSHGGEIRFRSQGRADPRRPRRGDRRAATRRVDDHRADRGVQPVARRHAHRAHRARTCSRGTGLAPFRPRSPGLVRADPLRPRRTARIRARPMSS